MRDKDRHAVDIAKSVVQISEQFGFPRRVGGGSKQFVIKPKSRDIGETSDADALDLAFDALKLTP